MAPRACGTSRGGHHDPRACALLLNMNTMKAESDQPFFVRMAVSPSQQRIAALTIRTVTLLDLSTGGVLARSTAAKSFGSDTAAVGAAAFSPDGRMIAVGSGSGAVALLDAQTLSPIGSPMNLHTAYVWSIGFGLDGKVLATGGALGSMVKLTDVASRRPWRDPIRGVEGSFPPQPMAVSADGRRLATGSPEQLVRVWDISSARLVASSPERVRFLHAVAFSPDGGLVAYSDERGSVFLWDTSGAPLAKTRCPRRAREHAGLLSGRPHARQRSHRITRFVSGTLTSTRKSRCSRDTPAGCGPSRSRSTATRSCRPAGTVTVRIWRATPSPAGPPPRSTPYQPLSPALATFQVLFRK